VASIVGSWAEPQESLCDRLDIPREASRCPRPIPSRETKIFCNNRSLAVRIPAGFGHPGDRVRITRDGEKLIIEPIKKDLLAILASLEPLGPEDDFADIDDGLLPLSDVEL
jgi:antitoxin VapB